MKKYKNPRIEVINIRSGGLGSGKSSSGICDIIRFLRRKYFLFRSRKLKHDYIIFSSIPLGKLSKDGSYRYICVYGHKIKCFDLNLDILLLQKRLPQDEVIIYIDEFSNIASQFDFNNPILRYNVDEFARNFRHYTHGLGLIYLFDQCSENIFLQVRRRANYTYNMISCRKLLFLPIMIYEYRKILLSDEVQNVVEVENSTEETEIKKFIYFSNPFKWYDSFAYSDRYLLIKEITKLTFNNETLKRNDVLKLNINGYLWYACLSADGISKEIFEHQNKNNKNNIIDLYN